VHGLDGDARATWYPQDNPTLYWPAWLGSPPLSLDPTMEKSTTMWGKVQEHLRWAESLWHNGQYRDTVFRSSVCTRHSLPCRSPSRGRAARGHHQRRRHCVAAGEEISPGASAKGRCRVGWEVARPSPSPDPDKRISRIRLFRRCGSGLRVSPTFRSPGDMCSNVNALGMVLS
jgi:hypothetical protein